MGNSVDVYCQNESYASILVILFSNIHPRLDIPLRNPPSALVNIDLYLKFHLVYPSRVAQADRHAVRLPGRRALERKLFTSSYIFLEKEGINHEEILADDFDYLGMFRYIDSSPREQPKRD